MHKLVFILSFIIFCFSQLNAQTKLPFADIHCHSSIKPYNSRKITRFNHWEVIEHNCDKNFSRFFVNSQPELPKRSQCNFETMMKGNVRVNFLSLTPLEKKMLQPRFLNIKKRGIPTFACLSGVESMMYIMDRNEIDYYKELAENIRMVMEEENKKWYIDDKAHHFELVRNKSQFQRILNEPNIMAVFFNLEGGHALGNSYYIDKNQTESKEYHDIVLKNIDRLKGIAPLQDGLEGKVTAPFISISLCHFFWNGLAGPARTFTGTQEVVFGKQKKANGGLTPIGYKAINRMLDKKEGWRILVDVKHMSLQARKDYYDILDGRMMVGDTIPIISSHSTISSYSWEDKGYSKHKDNYRKNKKSYLNQWTISLAKEDIHKIMQTQGLVGLMLDKYRIMGGKAKKKHKKTIPGSMQRRQVIIEAIMANIFTIVKHGNSVKAWDVVCMGSDYDGMITPTDNYETSEQWPELSTDLKNFLEFPRPIFDLFTVEEIERLKFGLSSEQIVNKVMSENVINFLLKNLPEE